MKSVEDAGGAEGREPKHYIAAKDRKAVIDLNKRGKEAIPLSPAEKQRFKVRSTMERSDAQLKDWLVPFRITVRERFVNRPVLSRNQRVF